MNFKEIIKNNGGAIRSIIKRITNEQNEDIEQEVYCKAWKNAGKYEEKGSFNAWIKTITSNLAKDYLKSGQKQIAEKTICNDDILSQVKDKSSCPEKRIIQFEKQKRISKAINELKPKLKEVILLSEIENKTYEEISKKLNCPIGTIKSRIYNAKKELSKTLEDLI